MEQAEPRAKRARLAHDDRKQEIVQAVLAVCANQGIEHLSGSSVTQRAGCTRSLFYHYFPNKDAALAAALDHTIDLFIERLRTWNASRVQGDIEGALESISRLLIDMVVNSPELPRSILNNGDAVLYTAFVHKVAERCARYLCETTVIEFGKRHEILIDHVYETFYVLISGLILYIRSHADVSVDVVKDIIASTLHIEGFTSKYPERHPER